MAATTVTQDEITSLAAKLDQLGAVLSDKERSLLLAVFRLASTAIASRTGHGGATGFGGKETESGGRMAMGDLAGSMSLSEGFAGAFRAVGQGSLVLDNAGLAAAGGVGIGIVY
jgi:hypothetical protein